MTLTTGELLNMAVKLNMSTERLVDFIELNAPPLIKAREVLMARKRIELILADIPAELVEEARESLSEESR